MQQENLVGSTLGQYQILDELGRGGMAVVYKAWQPSLRRYVALKVLLPYLGGDPEFIQRFQQEAIVAANLNHPNIVTIYEVGQQEGRIFIAMEYVEGQSLEQLIMAEGGLPLERAIPILRQVAAALDYAHKRRFLHRDIKPANILLSEDERVVITDFGIAKALEGSGATARLTSTGTVLGTPAYMSPEQIQGLPVDYRSDLYALGIVAYEMLSGQVPFDGTTTALLYAQVNNPPPAITRFAPGLPPHVEWVIMRMLAKQPSERFVSAGEFVEALASGSSGVSPTPGVAQPSRFPTPPPQNSTAVMPPGMQLPQPYGGTSPGAPNGYGYPPTQAAPGFPSAPPAPYGAPGGPPPVGYTPSVSPRAEPAPAKKKRKAWPWILGGVLLLGIVAAAVVLGYLFLFGETPAKLLEQGNTALAAQDYAAAQAAFEAVLEKDAENAAAYLGLGHLHYAQARYERAAEAYSNAVRLGPDNVEGYEGQGRSYYLLQKYDLAVEPLFRWTQLEPNNASAHYLLGMTYYRQGFDMASAIEHLEQGLALGDAISVEETIGIYVALGDAYCVLGEDSACIAAYEKAQQMDSGILQRLPEEALERLQRAYVANIKSAIVIGTAFSDLVPDSMGATIPLQDGLSGRVEGAVHLTGGLWPGSKALVVEEETMNLVKFPSFELVDPDTGGAKGWKPYHEGYRLLESNAYAGDKYVRIDGDANLRGLYSDEIGDRIVPPGSSLAISVHYRVTSYASGSMSVYLVGVENGVRKDPLASGRFGGGVTDGWTRRTLIYRNTSEGETSRLRLYFLTTDYVGTIDLDAVQVEIGREYSTSYCDGDQGVGYAWLASDAHASMSLRNATNVSLPVGRLAETTGSIGMWLRVDVLGAGAIPWFVEGSDGGMQLVVNSDGGGNLVLGKAADAVVLPPGTFVADEWMHVLTSWENGEVAVFVNGVLAAKGNGRLPSLGRTMLLGTNDAGGRLNGMFAELVVFARALSHNEVAALYELDYSLAR